MFCRKDLVGLNVLVKPQLQVWVSQTGQTLPNKVDLLKVLLVIQATLNFQTQAVTHKLRLFHHWPVFCSH
jgi:hypothetical protein